MAIRKVKNRGQENLSQEELEYEREQLLALRSQPNVDKKLIDMAMQSNAPRMSIDEVNEYLGRNRGETQ